MTNDGAGNLSGYAWSEKLGYISFDDASANNFYQVTLADDVVLKTEKPGKITLRTGTTLSPGQSETGASYFSGFAWTELGGYTNMDDSGSLYRPSIEYYVSP